MIGIHPDNQVPELKDYNVYTSDPALRRAVTRGVSSAAASIPIGAR